MRGLIRRAPTIPLHPLVQGLGWFSLALGFAELLMPRQVSRGAGMRAKNGLLLSYGLTDRPRIPVDGCSWSAPRSECWRVLR